MNSEIILHFTTSLASGGTERNIYNLISRSKNYRHVVVSLTSGGDYIDKLKEIKVEVYTINLKKNILDIFKVFYIIKILFSVKPSIIHCWTYHANLIAGFFSKIFFFKNVIWSIRTSNFKDIDVKFTTKIIINILSKFSYFIPKLIISNSQSGVKSHIKKGFKNNFTFIPNGCDGLIFKRDQTKKHKLKNNFKIKDDEYVIGMAARWDIQKNHKCLFKSLELIKKNKKIKFKLLLIGDKISNKNAKLLNLLKENNIFDNTLILDQTTDIQDIYNIFDLSILSSNVEGFPNVLIESMFCGVPCISSDVGDARNILKNNGDIFNLNDHNVLSDLIIKNYTIWENKELHKLKQNKIIKYVSSKYEINLMIRDYHEIRENLLNKKILHIINSLNQGGAEKALTNLIHFDKKNKHIIISLLGRGFFSNQLENKKIKIHYMKMSKTNLFLNSFLFLKMLFIVLIEKPKIIQTWLYHSDFLGSLISIILFKRNIFWTVVNFNLETKYNKLFTLIIIKINSLFSYIVPKKIICCSKASIKNHIKYGFSRNKFTYIPLGFDTELFSPNKTNINNEHKEYYLQKNKNKFIIGCVARWDKQKNHNFLINSFSALLKEHKNVHLVLVGHGLIQENKDLKKIIDNHNLSNNISLLGPQNDIHNLMNIFDLHVLVSYSEAFPNVLGEAMSCGTPCISSDVGDANDILGIYGKIININDSNQLIEKIKFFINYKKNVTEWSILKSNCRKHIMENYSISKILLKYEFNWIN